MLTVADVERVAARVFRGERVASAAISVTFLTTQEMRALNRRSFDRDRATDVIAFALSHDGIAAGDVYVCPAVARRSAAALRVPRRQEEIRDVVHGMLHALGYEHPEGASRTESPMWARQERYVTEVLSAGGR